MSAREWYKCPYCKSQMQKAKEEYGKIPIDKFLEKYKESLVDEDLYGDGKEPEDNETVRMDGEEWLDDDGTYHIEHGLTCNKCGRSWNINVKVNPDESDEESQNRNAKLTFKVPSKSGGDDHEVEVDNGNYKCDCVSFKTRKTCGHINQIKKRVNIER
jgi:uncharacterized protein YbaR (Trm112 family)